MKPNYESLKICHTTPFYHLLKYIPGENLIQIGIRQTDKEENETASKNGVTTFDAWEVHNDIDTVARYLQKTTAGKKIYISFDIDAYDLPYCTLHWHAGTIWPRPISSIEISQGDRSISLPDWNGYGRGCLEKWRLPRRHTGYPDIVQNIISKIC